MNRTSTPRWQGSTSSARRRLGWKTRQAKCTSASRRASRPATGTRMTEMLAEDVFDDDRRRVVGAGVRHGRDAEIASCGRSPMSGSTNITSTVIATRGERIALSRVRFAGSDQRPDAFDTEVLGIVEIDADDRIAARVAFDPDNIDAAFEELDARYLAGEAAAHSHTWSVITQAYAALNRRELAATTPDWVNIDHRRGDSGRARRSDPVHPCRVGRHAGHQGLHRGCASADQPRSGRHPRGRTGPQKRASTPNGGRSTLRRSKAT